MEPFKLTIKEPCHENWDNMSANEKGRFCQLCDKTVIDFTKKSPAQIQDVLKYANNKVCGRFNANDINRVLIPQPIVNPTRKFNSRWMAWLTVFAFLGFGKKASPQTFTTSGDKTPGKIDNQHLKTVNTKITGLVKNAETGKGAAEVYVSVYSGNTEIATAFTDANGFYSVDLPANTIVNFRIDIEFNGDLFELKTVNNLDVQKNEMRADVVLKPGVEIMHQVDIVYDRSELDRPTILGGPMYTGHTLGGVCYNTTHEESYEFSKDTTEEVNYFKDEIVLPKSISVNVYPNPTTSYVTVDVENAEKVSIQVFNPAGQLIYSESSGKNNKTVDFSKYVNGIYTIRVIDDFTHKYVSTRVVKMH